MNKIKATLLIITVSLLMTACEDQEKNKLDNRVMDYWNFKVERNFKEAYKFLSPGWRASESEIAYVQRMSQSTVKWLAASIKEKNCSKQTLCNIVVAIEYEYEFKGAMSNKIQVTSEITEAWLLKNNNWYNVPTESNIKQK